MEITMEELVSRRLGGGVWRMIDTRSGDYIQRA